MSKTWTLGDEIYFTYPPESGGRTHLFHFLHLTGDGRVVFLSGPAGSSGGGGLTLSTADAQTVWEANQAAARSFEDPLFGRVLRDATFARHLARGSGKPEA